MSDGEFAFIREKLAPLAAGSPGALGLTDDAALIDPTPGHQLVAASDALVAGVHFLEDDGFDVAARRALGSNLSDLAAMGAVPVGYLAAISWPRDCRDVDRDAFVAGLQVLQNEHGIALLGGDTVTTPGPFSIAITVLGEVPAGQALTRSGARPGDDVWVSGTIGDARLGLDMARGTLDRQDFLLQRYQCPQPRLGLGQALRGIASACIDVSDGLVADAGHVAGTSGVKLALEAPLVPLSAPVLLWLEKAPLEAAKTLLTGGDDYELLFTAPHARAADILALSASLALDLTWIGRVEEGAGVTVQDDMGQPMQFESPGFTHF